MTDLERRLRRAADPLPGADWADVRRRVRPARRRVVLSLAAALLVLISAIPALGLGDRVLDVVAVDRSDEDVPAPARQLALEYVHGRRVYRSGIEALGQLRAPLFAPFLGDSYPLVIPSPTRGQLLYHAWDGGADSGVPELRVYSSEGGPELVLARGAQSAAWRRDGTIAYLQALRPRYESSPAGTLGGHFGHVVVRASLDSPPVRWTRVPAQYVVIGWARGSLIVDVFPTLSRRTAIESGAYALDGPGRIRRLPIREVIAISPDGTRVLGSVAPSYDQPATAVRLVDVASGRAGFTLRVAGLDTPGDWVGDRIVAARVSGREDELVILRTTPKPLVVEQRLQLGEEPSLRPGLGPFLSRPVFVGGERYVVVRVASGDPNENVVFAGFLTCDRVERRCVRGRNLLPARVMAAVVDNPSRPE